MNNNIITIIDYGYGNLFSINSAITKLGLNTHITKNLEKIVNANLIILPGVGDYTAKAILGIGYNKPVMPVEANIKRMLASLYGLEQSINLIFDKIYFDCYSFFILKELCFIV